MPEKRGGSGGGGGAGGFNSLGLSPPILRGISRLGFRNPTPVQRRTLPIALSGTDVVVMARTGSGKTAAFLIPMLERLLSMAAGDSNMSDPTKKEIRAVILSPTRELSMQTLSVLKKISHYLNTDYDATMTISCGGIHGGQSMERQFELLASKPTIIVATPGRLAHHLHEIPDFDLKSVEILILDEADRLFEMGFAQQIRDIVRTMPKPDGSGRQTMLFSATMPKVLVEFTKSSGSIMNDDPTVVRLDAEVSVSDELRVGFITCRSDDKDAALLHLLRDVLPRGGGSERSTGDDEEGKKKGVNQVRGLTLVFAATRHHVEYLTNLINAALPPPANETDNSSSASKSKKKPKRKKPKTDLSSFTKPRRATMIYGTMDQEARQQSLSSFRSGLTPILVVTDVAARGIDVPLIDHVIHYAFPPNAKLFIHRSGRAARAGRIGWCWSLVEPEEMPYMVDLHLFLGRRLCNPDPLRKQIEEEKKDESNNDDDNDDDKDKSAPQKDYFSYTLAEMTPDMVHYGTVPESVLTEEVENVRRIVHSELSSSHDTDQLQSLQRVCNNAMKQYRKSRPEPSGEGLRRARDILEGVKDVTGRRGGNVSSGNSSRGDVGAGNGTIAVHPVLRWVEKERLMSIVTNNTSTKTNSANSNSEQVEKQLDSLRKREEFLRAMSAFRPKETIFETFGTGNKEKAGVMGQVDKGRTTSKNNANIISQRKHDSSGALVAMRGMRREMRLVRDKGSAMVVAGSKNALTLNGEVEEEEENEAIEIAAANDANEEEEGKEDNESSKPNKRQKTNMTSTTKTPDATVNPPEKRRMSKAERKRAKKSGGVDAAGGTTNVDDAYGDIASNRKTKHMRGTDFRDMMYFIGDANTGGMPTATGDASEGAAEQDRLKWVEMSMQPSSSAGSGTKAAALRMEEAMLDIVGDENADLVHRRRMMRWDKSKKRYVQTTVGEELGGSIGGSSKKMKLESGQVVRSDKLKLGAMYEKWQKKTNRSVGRTGVFDDVTEGDGDVNNAGITNARFRNGGADDADGGDKKDVKKTKAQILKERKAKANLKMKNMKKEDRKRLERKEKSNKAMAETNRPKGFQGKKGASGRWAAGNKRKR